MARKIFISYDYDNDKHYKNLLLAWNKHGEFDIEFYDQSVDVSINSTDANYIKQVIQGRIAKSDILLVLIGKQTYKSAWVAWEIQKAYELKKKLVAVKIDDENTSPDVILGKGALWTKSFNFDAIKSCTS